MLNVSMHPTTVYQAIVAQLGQELSSNYRCGEYLSSEEQLAERYAVNRHTLRRVNGVPVCMIITICQICAGGRRCSNLATVRSLVAARQEKTDPAGP